jgi:hypothetical protein
MNPGSDVKWQDYEQKDQLISAMVHQRIVEEKYGEVKLGDRCQFGGLWISLDEEFHEIVRVYALVERATGEQEKFITPTKEST